MPDQKVLHLPKKYADQVHALLQQYIPDAEVWAYGSRVNGGFFEASDLDLVAHFATIQKRDVFRLSKVREAFQESNLPIMVQIVDWDAIPESFRDEIRAGYAVVQGKSHDCQHP